MPSAHDPLGKLIDMRDADWGRVIKRPGPRSRGGYWLAWKLTEGASNEMFRLPLYVERASYGYAVLAISATVLVSGIAVAWRLFRFDLIGILKLRE